MIIYILKSSSVILDDLVHNFTLPVLLYFLQTTLTHSAFQ